MAAKELDFDIEARTRLKAGVDKLARAVKAADLDIPVVLLAWDTRELREFEARADTSALERTFVWQGDARILVAIVKSVEDQRNVEHDSRSVGVQVILLIEDNVRYYSSFLPVIYAELLQHSRRVVKEGLNLSQQIMRMRAGDSVCYDSSELHGYVAVSQQRPRAVAVVFSKP